MVFTSSTESLIHTESSRTIESSMPGGSSRRNSSTVAFRRSAISTVFPPRTLRMSMPMAETPFTIAAERGSSASSRVTATSPSRIGTPSRMSTTRRSNSSGSCNRPGHPHQPLAGAELEPPRRNLAVLRGQRGHDLRHRHRPGRHALGVHLHRDHALLARR